MLNQQHAAERQAGRDGHRNRLCDPALTHGQESEEEDAQLRLDCQRQANSLPPPCGAKKPHS